MGNLYLLYAARSHGGDKIKSDKMEKSEKIVKIYK